MASPHRAIIAIQFQRGRVQSAFSMTPHHEEIQSILQTNEDLFIKIHPEITKNSNTTVCRRSKRQQAKHREMIFPMIDVFSLSFNRDQGNEPFPTTEYTGTERRQIQTEILIQRWLSVLIKRELQKINKMVSHTKLVLNVDDIHWILTIPFTTEYQAVKELLEVCAEAVGLSSFAVCTDCICTTLSITPPPILLQHETRFLVIDYHANVIDAIALKAQSNTGSKPRLCFNILENLRVSNDALSSVDKQFQDLICEIFDISETEKCTSQVLKKHLGEVWQAKKRAFGQNRKTGTNFHIPVLSLIEEYGKDSTLSQLLDKYFRQNDAMRNFLKSVGNSILCISAEFVSLLFKPANDFFISFVADVVHSLKPIKFLLLSGDATPLNLLQDQLEFQMKTLGITVLRSVNTSTSIISGAVKYGHGPEVDLVLLSRRETTRRQTFGSPVNAASASKTTNSSSKSIRLQDISEIISPSQPSMAVKSDHASHVSAAQNLQRKSKYKKKLPIKQSPSHRLSRRSRLQLSEAISELNLHRMGQTDDAQHHRHYTRSSEDGSRRHVQTIRNPCRLTRKDRTCQTDQEIASQTKIKELQCKMEQLQQTQQRLESDTKEKQQEIHKDKMCLLQLAEESAAESKESVAKYRVQIHELEQKDKSLTAQFSQDVKGLKEKIRSLELEKNRKLARQKKTIDALNEELSDLTKKYNEIAN